MTLGKKKLFLDRHPMAVSWFHPSKRMTFREAISPLFFLFFFCQENFMKNLLGKFHVSCRKHASAWPCSVLLGSAWPCSVPVASLVGGPGGPWPPQYFGHASPRKLRKSNYKGLYLASISKWEVVDKVSRQIIGAILGARQILKAMQIPEAQFLIINANFHKKMKEKKPRLGNFSLAPLI